MVRMLKDNIYGYEDPSNLDSWQAWRELTDNFKLVRKKVKDRSRDGLISLSEYLDAVAKDGACPYCNNGKSITDARDLGKMYCLCHVLEYIIREAASIDPYRSFVDDEKFDEFNLEWDKQKADSLIMTLEEVKSFVTNPSGAKWLYIVGEPGCGKTKMLHAAAIELGPTALYINATSFETFVFRAMRKGELDELMETIMRAPILLFDDMGSEHIPKVSGDGINSPMGFVQQRLGSILNYRYEAWKEWPTIVTSNLLQANMRKRDKRSFSRMKDWQSAKFLKIAVGDYRQRRK